MEVTASQSLAEQITFMYHSAGCSLHTSSQYDCDCYVFESIIIHGSPFSRPLRRGASALVSYTGADCFTAVQDLTSVRIIDIEGIEEEPSIDSLRSIATEQEEKAA